MAIADRRQLGNEGSRDCAEPSPLALTPPGEGEVATGTLGRAVLEHSQDCIKLLDLDGRLQYMSPRGQRLLSICDLGRYLNMPYPTFWQGSGSQAALEAIAQARAGGTGRFQGYCPTEDGTPKWWDVVVNPILGANGEVERLLAVSRDVTQRKQAEEERERLLAQADEDRQRIQALNAQAQSRADELAAVLNAIPDPVAVWDAGGTVLRANPAAAALGIGAEGAPAPVVAERLAVRHPDGRPFRPEELPVVRALRGETIRDDAERLVDAAGEERDIVASAAPVFSDGKITAAVVVAHDVTEERRTEAALRESEEKLRTLFELMPIGISILDQDRVLVRQNAALPRIIGMARESLDRGEYRARTYLRSDGTVMPLDELPSVRAWKERKPVRGEVGIVTEDGTVLWTDVSAAPVPFADWSVVVTTSDFTERREAEAAVRRARDDLEMRVQERTAELERANQRLLAEIRERARVEAELRQSEQQLERRVEERTRELATLLEISNTVGLTIDLETLLALIFERLKGVVDHDGGVALRLEDGTLTPVFERGAIPADDLLRVGSALERAAPGRGAVLGPEPMILADVQAEPALREAFWQASGARSADLARAVRAWMAVPVTIKQQAYGVLYLYHGQPGRYGEEQARLALAFGNQAAVAIENARLYTQAQELATLEERQHLARELHDAVSQTLFSAGLAAEVLPRLWEADRQSGLECLAEVRQLTRGALAEMRALLLELRPAALGQTDLATLLQQLAQAASSRTRIPVTVQADAHSPLPPGVRVTLYRIAQEALNNVAKHAQARQADVNLRFTRADPQDGASPIDRVELTIADDGRGFDPGLTAPGDRGMGLVIMRERAEAIGAALDVASAPGRGTRLTVTWPAGDR